MKILTDLHSHTYPASHDGVNTLQEMVQTALEKRLDYYGISNHIDYDYDERAYTNEERALLVNGDERAYFEEARQLQRAYKGKIQLLVGAEFGCGETQVTHERYLEFYKTYRPDYVINSVHGYHGKDYSRRDLPNIPEEVIARYLRRVRQSLDVPYPYDIVGHFEYVVRYAPFADQRIYVSKWQAQIDDILSTIIQKGKILEVNSAVKQLHRTCLPSAEILRRYYDLGGRKITFGSDAHNVSRIADKREEVVALMKDIGFTHFIIPIQGEYIEVEI